MLPSDTPAVTIKDWLSPYNRDSASLDPTKFMEWDSRRMVWCAPRPNGDGVIEVADNVVQEHIETMMNMGQSRTSATHAARSVEYWYQSGL
jgi:hypothetical protein